jgi:hypothetical protein
MWALLTPRFSTGVPKTGYLDISPVLSNYRGIHFYEFLLTKDSHMRLVAFALLVVVAFPLGALAIQHLMPDIPLWLKLTFAILLPFWLCYGLLTWSDKRLGERSDQKHLLLGALTAVTLIAAFLAPMFIHGYAFPKWVAELLISVIAVSVFLIFRQIPVHRTRQEVIEALGSAVQSGWDASFDKFVRTRIAEPELEAVRLKCSEVNADSSEELRSTLKSFIAELRAGTEEQSQ